MTPTSSLTAGAPGTRTRDPRRREKILAAAATLVARNGYHAVSMADIGAEAGIVGSGVYRHFDSKAAILVAIFEDVIDRLLGAAQEAVESDANLGVIFDRLINEQVSFVVEDRAIAQVYHHEIMSLPDDDRRRLRRKQRLYLEEWVHLLREFRPELDEAHSRTLVHAAIGAIQSSLFHNIGLEQTRLTAALASSARAVLGLDVTGTVDANRGTVPLSASPTRPRQQSNRDD